MAKYNERLIEKITTLIEEDTYSISEICALTGISRKTFYQWKDSKPDFAKALRKATENRDEQLSIKARRSLKKKLDGYTLTEIKTTYIPDANNPSELKIKSRIVKEKEYAPDTSSIKLVIARDDESTKNMECKFEKTPLHITVTNTDAAKQLRILQQNCMNKVPVKRHIKRE